MTPVAYPVRRFVCPDCNHVHAAWAARCLHCHSLKGLVLATADLVEGQTPSLEPTATPAPEKEVPIVPIRPRLVIARAPEPELTDPAHELDDDDEDDPTPITEISATSHQYKSTTIGPLDAVLGGGVVDGEVILLASPPGSGKTSLTLKALVGLGHRCIYASAEETKNQIAVTAHRIQTVSPDLFLMHEQDLEKIFRKARKFKVNTIAIDSIQKMVCTDIKGRPGSPTQLKACSERIRSFAKLHGISFFVICHITSDGDIQGPKTVEHDVDVVLEIVPGPRMEGNERILQCPSPGKNRFGPTNVEGRFCMTATGLEPLDPDGWDEEL